MLRLSPLLHPISHLIAALIFMTPLIASPASAEGDAALGEKIFVVCRSCHQIGETAKNAVGPQLNGVIGRKAATAANYNYSDAYKALDKVWNDDNFRIYIKDPRGVTPGTKMTFPGLKEEEKITDLLAFLKQYGLDGKKK